MIKVLVVDDSLFDRKLIAWLLNANSDIEVIGMAEDPYEARKQIVELKPDVITLDMLMPRMDGLTFLKKLMKHFPMPVVVVSSVTPANSKTALAALRVGAVEVICKPNMEYGAQEMAHDLTWAVRAASKAKVSTAASSGKKNPQHRVLKNGPWSIDDASEKLIAIGSSTGGTRALEAILPNLPENIPGIVIVQHMPEVFTKNFANRLNSLCRVDVAEAQDGDIIQPGKVLIAPGNHHMKVQKSSGHLVVRIVDGEPVSYHKPSVDVLMNSVAEEAGSQAMGIILTGMGSDGAKGLLKMKNAGAYTIVQDEATSVVYGMPRQAANIGAACEVLSLDEIPTAMLHQVERKNLELISS